MRATFISELRRRFRLDVPDKHDRLSRLKKSSCCSHYPQPNAHVSLFCSHNEAKNDRKVQDMFDRHNQQGRSWLKSHSSLDIQVVDIFPNSTLTFSHGSQSNPNSGFRCVHQVAFSQETDTPPQETLVRCVGLPCVSRQELAPGRHTACALLVPTSVQLGF